MSYGSAEGSKVRVACPRQLRRQKPFTLCWLQTFRLTRRRGSCCRELVIGWRQWQRRWTSCRIPLPTGAAVGQEALSSTAFSTPLWQAR
jgi:hypothetical protein